jgi:hypothetical protein
MTGTHGPGLWSSQPRDSLAGVMAIPGEVLEYVVDFLVRRREERRATTRADVIRGIVFWAIIAAFIVGLVWWRNR